jgi:phosphate acyltransferase
MTMTAAQVISVDVMGGDHGLEVVVKGVARAAKLLSAKRVRFLLNGDPAPLGAALGRLPSAVREMCDVRPSDKTVAMDEKPVQAIRKGAGSSMWGSVQAVKDGEAHAAVSAGNTGALMAIAKLLLRMSADMDRPALIANWPTMRGRTAVLDVGANLQCSATRLLQFAIMGAAFHHAVNHSKRPTVGLLNTSWGDDLGRVEILEANRLLGGASLDFDYHGFVDGSDITAGTVDVVVTDGFTGNVALKSGEGIARLIKNELRTTFTANLRARLGALLVRHSLRAMASQLNVSGSPFLGLNGIVVKVHGGADAKGIAAAIVLAADLAEKDFSAEIDRNLRQLVAAPAK